MEPVVGEPVGEGLHLYEATEGGELGIELSALEAEEAVGEGVMTVGEDVLTDNLDEVREGHDGAADDEMEAVVLVLTAPVDGLAVLQSDGSDDLLGDTNLLAGAVDEAERALGKEDGKGDAGEAAAGAEIEETGAGTEGGHTGDGEGMEDMVEIEVVDVLTGDDVDLLVPLAVECVEGSELGLLLGGEMGEVVLEHEE
jgi:hypothetical protein